MRIKKRKYVSGEHIPADRFGQTPVLRATPDNLGRKCQFTMFPKSGPWLETVGLNYVRLAASCFPDAPGHSATLAVTFSFVTHHIGHDQPPQAKHANQHCGGGQYEIAVHGTHEGETLENKISIWLNTYDHN